VTVAGRATQVELVLEAGSLQETINVVHHPAHLGQAGREDVVVLDAVIGTDGFVRDARALDQSVNADFLAAAVKAVQQWQFTPTLLNCTAISVHMNVTVRFRLQ
jgi:TonB family protein